MLKKGKSSVPTELLVDAQLSWRVGKSVRLLVNDPMMAASIGLSRSQWR